MSPTAPFLPTAEEMGERTPAETAFLHFLSALCLFAAVRFPSRNRCCPDRCRSPDCASTAFRCRCLLLRQTLLFSRVTGQQTYHTPCPQGTPTHCGASRRNGRDLIIATRPAHPPLPSHRTSGSGAGIVSRPGVSAFFVSDGPISSNSGRNGGKNAGRNCVSALPQRAMPVRCRPRFPSRNRRFPDRCRSPDCASTAFRYRCLLLRQKLFVLPCRRLRNNYIRARRAHLPLPPQGGKGAI